MRPEFCRDCRLPANHWCCPCKEALAQGIKSYEVGEHHVWCNFFGRRGPCRMCDNLYAKYPYDKSDPEAADKLMSQHFPDAVRVR